MPVPVPRPSRRVPRPSLVALGLLVAAAGLTGCDEIDGSGALKTTGAKLVPSATVVTAGDEITLDIAGSELTGRDTCPRVAYFFLDSAEGSDGRLTPLETLKTEKSCRVTRGQLKARLKAGAPGSTRRQVVSVRLEAFQGNNFVSSVAETTIEVRTPAAGAPGTPQPPGTPPTTPPTPPTPTTPTTPPLEPVQFSCTPESNPPQFTIGYDVNPGYGNTAFQSILDASRTTSTAGPITQIAWDYDGDGTADRVSSTPVLALAPAAEKLYAGCYRVTDSTGATATHPTYLVVSNTAARVGPFTVSPSSPRVGETATVTPAPGPTGTNGICVTFIEPVGGASSMDCSAPYEHAFGTAGPSGQIQVSYDIDSDGAGPPYNDNYWSDGIAVRAVGGRATVRAAAKRGKGGSVSLTVPLSGPSKLVKRGKVTLGADGAVDIKDAIITGRMTAKATKKQRRRAPAALSFLLGADFASKMSGRRVLLDARTEGLAGTGKLLARSTRDRRTLVCLAVRTNGGDRTTWTILGATGKARGWVGGGTGTAPTAGPGTSRRSASLTVKRGKPRGIGACGALKGRLPAAKKGAK